MKYQVHGLRSQSKGRADSTHKKNSLQIAYANHKLIYKYTSEQRVVDNKLGSQLRSFEGGVGNGKRSALALRSPEIVGLTLKPIEDLVT